MSKKVYKYSSFEDDFFDDGREHRLPDNYVWIKNGLLSRIKATLAYGIALVFSNIYCRLFLHIRFKNKKKLRKYKGGFFIYANHTQPVGDVFTPALLAFPKRIYTVVSPANFDLPVIGKLIFSLGALPTPSSIKQMRAFREAVKTRIGEGHPVVIYPEARVWHYYNGIRPFSEVSFMLPEMCGAPAFVMTSVYKKRRFGKKPKIEVYLSDALQGDGNTPKGRALSLRDKVYAEMCGRAEQSNCEYIKYEYVEKDGES